MEPQVGSLDYDVFINFRGEDTRNNFVGHLYSALKYRGIHAFIDKDLSKGDDIWPELLRSIKGSKLSIAVFSERYAESKWCLRELAQMLECHETNGQIFLHIFFKVNTSHVKNQTGPFKISPQRHGKEAPETLQRWKDALRAAGDKSGWVFKDGDDESKLVDDVAHRAWTQLSVVPLTNIKHPVGLESRVEAVLSLLSTTNSENENVQFIGICGMGGSGKTTIATAVYNHVFKRFSKSCFLENIREQASQPNGITCLQEKLLKSIFQEEIRISNSKVGSSLIKKRLGKTDTLLILDDVGNHIQVDALAGGDPSLLGPGSKIIITSRDQSVLCGIPEVNRKIYEPEGLSEKESLRLFSLHAFNSMDQPPGDYMQLSVDIVGTTGGLPLALEVLGSDLCMDRDMGVWKSRHEMLKQIPAGDVYRKLKITYDNLEDDIYKAMFLDAACFFIGWEEETIMPIWEACGFEPRYRIEVLKRKFLLKITTEREQYLWMHNQNRDLVHSQIDDMRGPKQLLMHDQIRDMGRRIVYEELGKYNRLWSPDNIMEVVKGGMGNGMVEGIVYQFPLTRLDTECFEKMAKLRLLLLHGVTLEGRFHCLPSALRWLSWMYCPLEELPADNFYHERLVFLDLSHGQFSQAWNNWLDNKKFQQLKVLQLGHCSFLSESPDFSGFPRLERLDLGHCLGLVNLHESIGNLKQLIYLNLKDCISLQKLPNSICRLSSLEKLILNSCYSLSESPDFSGFPRLERLDLGHCLELVNLHESIGNLKQLIYLNLENCIFLQKLPNSICRLSSLEKLILNSCESLKKLPRSIGDLKEALVELSLKNTNIEALPGGVGLLKKLKVLDLSHWHGLVDVPSSLEHMTSLRYIQLSGLAKLRHVPKLPSSLIELRLCVPYRYPTDVHDMKKLELLCLKSLCVNTEQFKGVIRTSYKRSLWMEERKRYEENWFRIHYSLLMHDQGTILEGNYECWRQIWIPMQKKYEPCGYYLVPDDICGRLVMHVSLRDYGFVAGLVEDVPRLSLTLKCKARIYRKVQKPVYWDGRMRIADIKLTSRDTELVHKFGGFDWFGFQLERGDAIEILKVDAIEILHVDPTDEDGRKCEICYGRKCEICYVVTELNLFLMKEEMLKSFPPHILHRHPYTCWEEKVEERMKEERMERLIEREMWR